MKNIRYSISIVLFIILSSCSSEQSLQQYYVNNAENPNFLSFDLPASLLNLEKVELNEEEKEAVSSLKKLNVLAFQKKEDNNTAYIVEKAAIKAILKGPDFSELMKMNTEFGRATIRLKGDDDAIDEIVIYGDNDEKGFILIRVLGTNMNPANFVQLIKAMEKSNFVGKGLEQLGDLIKG